MEIPIEKAILDRSVNFPFAERDTATSDAEGLTAPEETQIQGDTRSGLRKATTPAKPLSSGYNRPNSPTN